MAMAPGNVLRGTKSAPYDPGFETGKLANNGGPTKTLALAITSYAINAGENPLNLSYDQRDGATYYRVYDNIPDIGAFELPIEDDT